MSQQELNDLHKKIEVLTRTVAAREEVIKERERQIQAREKEVLSEIQSRDFKIRKLEDVIQERDEEIKHRDEEIRHRDVEIQLWQKKTNELIQADAARDAVRTEHIAQLDGQIEKLKVHMKEKTARMEQAVEEAVTQVKLEAGPQWTNNQAVLEVTKKEGEVTATAKAQIIISDLDERLRSAEEMILERESQIHQLQKHQRGISHQSSAQQAEITELRSQLDRRYQLKTADRQDYRTYQKIYGDLRSHAKELNEPSNQLQDIFHHEAQLWQRSHKAFYESEIYSLLSQKYRKLLETISDFTKRRESEALSTAQFLANLKGEFHDSYKHLTRVAHRSRHLTKHHHFQEELSLHETVELAGSVAYVWPFSAYREEAIRRTKFLKERIDVASDKQTELRLRRNLGRQFATCRLALLCVEFFSAVRDVETLKALLCDSVAEKRVYVASKTPNRRIEQAAGAFTESMRDRSWLSGKHGISGQELEDYLRAYKEKAVEARVTQESVESLVRKAGLLAEHLQQHDGEAPKLDMVIRNDLAEVEQKRERALDKLLGAQAASNASGSGGSRPTAATRAARIGSQRAFQTIRSPTPTLRRVRSMSLRRTSKYTTQISSPDVEAEYTEISPRDQNINLGLRPTQARHQEHRSRPFDFSANHDDTTFEDTVIPSHATSSSILGLESTVSRAGSREAMSRSFQLPRVGSQPNNSTRDLDDDSDGSMFEDSLSDGFSSYSNDSRSDESETIPLNELSLDEPENTNYSINSDAMPSTSEAEALVEAEDENVVALIYRMSPEDYRNAATASPNTDAAYWSYKLYKDIHGKQPQVFYCTTFEKSEQQARLFVNEPVLGFDIEWMPFATVQKRDIKSNVSLIQIAAEDKIGLFHIACFSGNTAEDLMPPTLRAILESPEVAKAGVNIIGDSNRMQSCLNVNMKGVFELSHLYRVVRLSEQEPRQINFKLVGLAQQVLNVLRLPLKKDEVRISQWASRLSGQQTHYAAADAYAGFRLYRQLDYERRRMNPMPPRPAFLELDQPLVLGDGTKVFRSRAR